MSGITLKNLNKTYPNGFLSVKNVSLSIEDGEFVTFHGPSGCGKSTILRMIGGLEEITSGEIYLGDVLLNEVLPRDRRLSMAFQNYALYPGLNVYENIGLGLTLRDFPRNIIDSRVQSAAEFLQIPDILNKKIRSITEAQKQKTALARAIVCHPKVFLVDEDFSRGNARRRAEMLRDVLRINQELKLTTLYITNDYQEAINLKKKIIFMKDGEIIPAEEYEV
ncbi:MAG: ATP-binding cassette domain-containing protein [Ruminococcus sp.]|nr:ATP-binding cassette domain-containing protein [uncultured Schaedlerella sp.]MCI9213196.1 ATP-binding cassette domain-containing protein [Ruminococcus sp.]